MYVCRVHAYMCVHTTHSSKNGTEVGCVKIVLEIHAMQKVRSCICKCMTETIIIIILKILLKYARALNWSFAHA